MNPELKNTAIGRRISSLGKGTLSAANRLGLMLYLAGEHTRAHLIGHPREAIRTGLRTGIVAHVYYPDLFGDILACRNNLPADAICHVTAPPDVAAALGPQIQGMPGTYLHIVENRGRDIAPFLSVLKSGALDGLDAVLKIHSKRSPHLSHGGLLRRAMFHALAGRRDVVARILTTMEAPEAGMVGWRRVFLTRQRHWHGNRDRVLALAAQLDPPAQPALSFFGGSMFWFRPQALASLAALPLSVSDFEAEAGQIDGTLHHALERCFAIATAAAGFSVLDTEGRKLLPPR
jgi:rhamnosyltransferase